jgi:hypothetical protein
MNEANTLADVIGQDEAVEQEIQRKGLTAPRVTPADIEHNIASEHYFTARQGTLGAMPLDFFADNFMSCTVPTSCRPDGVDGDPARIGTNLLSFSEAKEMLSKCILSTAPKTLDLLTFCVLVLRNGFTVTGESACASPENFDAELGRKIARQNAVAKMWPLMGYALRQELAAKQDER